MYNLICQDKNNQIQIFKYDQLNNSLLDEQKNKYFEYKSDKNFYQKGYIIRISMGKKCNANCKYCLQDKNEYNMIFSTNFVNKIVELTNGNINNIQFWGGEPLVYFNQIIKIYNKFKSLLFNNCRFSICTNGILLKEQYIRDWFLNHKKDFSLSLSHDGPGQILRGEDPLKNKNIVNFLNEFFIDNNACSINPVMTKYNKDLTIFNEYIKNTLQTNFIIADARPIIVNNEKSLSCIMNDEEIKQYSKSLTHQVLTNKINNWSTIEQSFDYSLNKLNNPYKKGPKCFVGDKKTIVTDTEGNIVPCQGFSKNSIDQYGNSMYLGNIFDINNFNELKNPPIKRSIEKQEKCENCVLANFCNNGCPYGPIEYEDINCKYNFYYSMPLFSNFIYKLTNTVLLRIEEL